MTLERRLALIVALAITFTFAIGGAVLLSDSRANLERAEKEQIEAISLVLVSAMAQAEALTLSHSELIAADPRVVALMKAGDRAGLQALMKPVFDSLKLQASADVLHFHSADMKSFLRVWKPEDFGQDLTMVRPMVLTANRSRRSQKGLEIGFSGLSLRATSVIRDLGTVVGTVETGVNLAAQMELAKSTTGADFGVFLSPDSIFDGAGGFGSANGPLQLDAATNADLFTQLREQGFVALSRDQTTHVARIGDKVIGVLDRPLLDYSGKMIGTLVVARDVAALEAGFFATVITVSVVTLCGLLIAYGLFMVIIRTMVTRPLEQLAVDCETGTESPPASAIPAYLRIRAASLRRRPSANDDQEQT